MSTWQERIRNAFGARDAQEHQQIADQLRRREENERLTRKERESREEELTVLTKIFSNVRPDALLEMVNADIWGGVGKVTRSEISAQLEYRRKGIRSVNGQSQGGDTIFGPDLRGMYYDRFEISTFSTYSGGFIVSYYNGFIDSESGSYSQGVGYQSDHVTHGVHVDGVNYLKARQDLEEAVMKICEPRIVNGSWPFRK